MTRTRTTALHDPGVDLTIAGEQVRLLPERGVWWPGSRTLIVSDLHLGKEAAFCATGVGVPRGVMHESLERLTSAAQAMGASRVLVVGDLLHARVGLSPDVVESVAAWRKDLDAELWIVPGNHDRGLDRVSGEWSLQVCEEEVVEGSFGFRHEPRGALGATFTWAGHVHPSISLGDQSGRVACFSIGRRIGLLPAFSRFTGGGRPSAGDAIYAAAGGRVVALRTRIGGSGG